MNAHDIVCASPLRIHYSQGYVESNIPDQSGGSILTGKVEHQPQVP